MSETAQRNYPTDLTDGQWALIQPLLPESKSGPGKSGRPTVDQRMVINAILYVVKIGCQWRMLAQGFGAWQTIYRYFNTWSRATVWQGIMEELNMMERRRQGRHPEPTAGCIDSQSVKAALQPTDQIGFDGNKKIKGRKRHVLTDTLGLILCVVVTAANTDDREGLRALLSYWFIKGVCRLRKLWVDAGYTSASLRQWVRDLKRTHKIDLEVTDHDSKGFQVVPKRWVVERAFSWLLGYRRHSKDYEVLTRNSEAMIQLAMISILLRRLAKS
jgi:putative transposase